MNKRMSAARYAVPKAIAITVFLSIFATAWVLLAPPFLLYWGVGLFCLFVVVIFIGTLKEIRSGRDWVVRIEGGEFEMDGPALEDDQRFCVRIEDIERLKFTKNQRNRGPQSRTYRLKMSNGETHMFPRESPWSDKKIKEELERQGVTYWSEDAAPAQPVQEAMTSQRSCGSRGAKANLLATVPPAR